MKRILSIIIAAFILLPASNGYAKETVNKPLATKTWYAAVIDADSGRMLYEKNSTRIVPMASTTKIMTAILAIENSSMDELVSVSKRASSIHGSTVGLKTGEKLRMEEMLYGLMLQSGNDCAVAIAEHISGSVEKFADLMNSKAFDIGAFNSRFSSPHGLDSSGHFTTARDLAMITRYAFKYDIFARIVSTKTITFNDGAAKRSFHNTNRLLWSMEGADGVKTGYTGKAGRCLVSSVSKNGRRFICVVLNSQNRWEDSKKLLEYVYNNYTEKIDIEADQFKGSIMVDGGNKQRLSVGLKESISVPLTRDEKENLLLRALVPDSLQAPVYENQQVGRLVLYSGNSEIYSVPYIASGSSRVSESKTLIDRILGK